MFANVLNTEVIVIFMVHNLFIILYIVTDLDNPFLDIIDMSVMHRFGTVLRHHQENDYVQEKVEKVKNLNLLSL